MSGGLGSSFRAKIYFPAFWQPFGYCQKDIISTSLHISTFLPHSHPHVKPKSTIQAKYANFQAIPPLLPDSAYITSAA